jgi:hypothetical protein
MNEMDEMSGLGEISGMNIMFVIFISLIPPISRFRDV